MSPCHYIPLEPAALDLFLPYSEDLFDLDLLCTEEGIFINATPEE